MPSYRNAAEESAYRGVQAESELRETERAFDDIRQGLFESIAKSDPSEQDLREHLYASLRILDAVKARLFSVAAGRAIGEHDDLIRSIMEGKDG